MKAHLRTKATLLTASVSLLAPAAAQASNPGSNTQGGWSWWDAAIWGGALLGIILFGLFGDVVVGAVIVGIVTIASGSVALVTNAGRVARKRVETRGESGRPLAMRSSPISARGRRQEG